MALEKSIYEINSLSVLRVLYVESLVRNQMDITNIIVNHEYPKVSVMVKFLNKDSELYTYLLSSQFKAI
jgi:hypothetical protein